MEGLANLIIGFEIALSGENFMFALIGSIVAR